MLGGAGIRGAVTPSSLGLFTPPAGFTPGLAPLGGEDDTVGGAVAPAAAPDVAARRV